jgi:hypothetical protein
MNEHPRLYITVHQLILEYIMVRKNYTYIRKRYTIDYFPICHQIHPQASPSILVH